MGKKAVILLSGGIDSTTLLYAMMMDYECYPITMSYGQRHSREVMAARNVCEARGGNLIKRWKYVDLGILGTLLPSSLTGVGEIPEGHYADESMKSTVVPNRNMILLAIAGGYANGMAAEVVAYGPHSGDHFIYPDCRPEFIEAVGKALELGTGFNPGEGVKLITPFSGMNKTDIVKLGKKLNVPYHLTWSCIVPGTPILTDQGWRSIDALKVGDIVLTHRNRWRPITQVFRKSYSGSLVTMKSYGLPFTLRITPEHLMSDVLGGWTCARHIPSYGEIPQYAVPAGTKYMDPRLAVLYGWFAAEGGYAGIDGIQYSFGEHETSYIEEVVKLGRDVWNLEAKIYTNANHGTNVNFFSRQLMAEFEALVGQGDTSTRNWFWMLNYVPEVLKLFTSRVFCGDGYDSDNNGQLKLSVTNFDLATTIFEAEKILDRVPNLVYKSAKSSNGVLPQWVVGVPWNQVLESRFSNKFQSKEVRKLHTVLFEPYVGDVCNIEVEEDQSYVASGFKVHNCYKGGEEHCGVCGTCTERKEAFKLAGVKDPTKYLA